MCQHKYNTCALHCTFDHFIAYNVKLGFMKSEYVFNENSGLASITLILSEPLSSDINVTIYSGTKKSSNGEYNYTWYCTME